MANFITKTDLDQDIYEEILSGVTRKNDENITQACIEAQDEIDGYISGRYDANDLLNKTGINRNQTILAIARTIAIYKLHKVCNKMTELRRIDYEDAIELLGKIQSGKFILKNAKLAGQTESVTPDSFVTVTSNPKRINHY